MNKGALLILAKGDYILQQVEGTNKTKVYDKEMNFLSEVVGVVLTKETALSIIFAMGDKR